VGFGQLWCDLCLILSTSSTQVSDSQVHPYIIGVASVRVTPSPMLFIFVMDVLNSLVEYATREQMLQPLAV